MSVKGEMRRVQLWAVCAENTARQTTFVESSCVEGCSFTMRTNCLKKDPHNHSAFDGIQIKQVAS